MKLVIKKRVIDSTMNEGKMLGVGTGWPCGNWSQAILRKEAVSERFPGNVASNLSPER